MIIKKRYKRLTKGDWFFVALMSIGGINSAVIGLFNVNLFERLLGFNGFLENSFSLIVGLSSFYVISLLFKSRKKEHKKEWIRPYEPASYRYQA